MFPGLLFRNRGPPAETGMQQKKLKEAQEKEKNEK